MGAALKEYLKAEGFKSRTAVIGLPAMWLMTKGHTVPPSDETTRAGALLILDEVISGFRLAPGGAAERLGLVPDLATFGKVIGGGLPVGAFGGRRELLAALAPTGPVYQAGTLSGNPLAVDRGPFVGSLAVFVTFPFWTLQPRGYAHESELRERRLTGDGERRHHPSVSGCLECESACR